MLDAQGRVQGIGQLARRSRDCQLSQPCLLPPVLIDTEPCHDKQMTPALLPLVSLKPPLQQIQQRRPFPVSDYLPILQHSFAFCICSKSICEPGCYAIPMGNFGEEILPRTGCTDHLQVTDGTSAGPDITAVERSSENNVEGGKAQIRHHPSELRASPKPLRPSGFS